MSKLLKTPEGKDINHEQVGILLKTPAGKQKNRERVTKTRETDKGIQEHRTDERIRISKTRKADWEKIKNKCREYTCAICVKQEWKTNMLKLEEKGNVTSSARKWISNQSKS